MKKTSVGESKFLAGQRAKLEELRARRARRTSKVESDLARTENGAEIDSEEQAVERENDEVLSAPVAADSHKTRRASSPSRIAESAT